MPSGLEKERIWFFPMVYPWFLGDISIVYGIENGDIPSGFVKIAIEDGY